MPQDCFEEDLPETLNYTGLYRKALSYCSLYGGTRKRVAQILTRYIRKHATNETEITLSQQLIPDILTRITQEKFIDDASFTQARINTRLRKGDSFILLKTRLSQQGVTPEDINHAFVELLKEESDAEYYALQNYARKHGIGCDQKNRNIEISERIKIKQTQKLMMHGFPSALIQRFWQQNL